KFAVLNLRILSKPIAGVRMPKVAQETLRGTDQAITYRDVRPDGDKARAPNAQSVPPAGGQYHWIKASPWRALLFGAQLFGVAILPAAVLLVLLMVQGPIGGRLQEALVPWAAGLLGVWTLVEALCVARWLLDRRNAWLISNTGIAIYHKGE